MSNQNTLFNGLTFYIIIRDLILSCQLAHGQTFHGYQATWVIFFIGVKQIVSGYAATWIRRILICCSLDKSHLDMMQLEEVQSGSEADWLCQGATACWPDL